MKQSLFSFFGIALFVSLFVLGSCGGSQSGEPTQQDTTPVSYAPVTHPEWAKTANIYEVNLRQYTQSGTINEFVKELPRLKAMGVDILWFMPIHPIGVVNRKGTLGSYYSVKDYKAVAPEFGTMEDFKAMVDSIHKMNMYIIIDWVANHTAWDNEMLANHKEWYTLDSTGKPTPPEGTDWSDVIDLNYENMEMRKYMIDALKFWVKEANIDGYRCDVADWVPVEFWNQARKELDEIKPVFMLAEAENPELHKHAFDMTYGWHLHHVANQIAKKEKDASELVSYFNQKAKEFQADDYRMLFTSNHDENSWNGTEFERMGKGTSTFAVLMATVPGMPLIYSGQEVSMNKRLEFFEKDPIDWKKGKDISGFYKTLFELKKRNQALWNGTAGGTMTIIDNSENKAVFAFVREKEQNKVVVYLNLSEKPVKVKVNNPVLEGEFTNVFNGKKVAQKADNNITLAAWEYMVLEK